MFGGQLAWIKFLPIGGEPSHPIVIPPPSPGEPAHPIVIPDPPLSPEHPIVIPPDSISDGVPTHPIVIPPEIWRPVFPEHPIAPGGEPPKPVHPIAPGGKPPGTWGGAGEPFPTPPIHIPPPPPGAEGSDKARVLVIYQGEAVWFTIDANDQVKPPPTEPQPKPSRR